MKPRGFAEEQIIGTLRESGRRVPQTRDQQHNQRMINR